MNPLPGWIWACPAHPARGHRLDHDRTDIADLISHGTPGYSLTAWLSACPDCGQPVLGLAPQATTRPQVLLTLNQIITGLD